MNDFISALSELEKSIIGTSMMIHDFNPVATAVRSDRAGFPPHNVIKMDDSHWCIEVALAGFQEKDVLLTQDGSRVIICGEKLDNSNKTYVHKGIATRKFTKEFNVGEYVHVCGALLKDGILTIDLEQNMPEKLKPRKIQLNQLNT